MPTTAQERARNASAKAAENRQAERFHKYAVEMSQAPIPDDVLAILAQELHLRGWTVVAPGRDRTAA